MEAAPVETTEPVEVREEAPKPAKPRTPDDDYDDILKKTGGLKYKAAGKEKSVTSAADLRRLLSRVDGTDSAASEALKAKAEADNIKSQVNSLAKLKPEERIRALESMGIPRKLIREAIEQDILSEDDRRQEQEKLSPRERELQSRLDAQETQLREHNQAKAEWEAKQVEDAHVAQSSAMYEKITTIAAKALQTAKIAGTHVPRFLPAIASEIDRAEGLGLEYDENDIAETVVKEHATLARDYYSGLDVEAHAEELSAMEMPDPENPAKTTTRLKMLMRREARRLKAMQSGVQPSAPRPSNGAQPGGQRQMTAAEKLDAARTFGGG